VRVGRGALYWLTVSVGAVAGFVVFALAPGPGGSRFVPAAGFVLILVSAAVVFKRLAFKSAIRLLEGYSTAKNRD
jgi:hypothetical protein